MTRRKVFNPDTMELCGGHVVESLNTEDHTFPYRVYGPTGTLKGECKTREAALKLASEQFN